MNHKQYDDNVLVARKRYCDSGQFWYSCEYFRVVFREYDKNWPEANYKVSIRRYCVPGRIDSYFFCQSIDGGIVYKSEGGLSLDKSLKMLQADLDRKQVVKMLTEFCDIPRRLHYIQTFEQLLKSLAPKSKSTKAISKMLEKYFEEIRIKVQAPSKVI